MEESPFGVASPSEARGLAPVCPRVSAFQKRGASSCPPPELLHRASQQPSLSTGSLAAGLSRSPSGDPRATPGLEIHFLKVEHRDKALAFHFLSGPGGPA